MKKSFLIVAAVGLLAAGCGSKAPTTSQSTTQMSAAGTSQNVQEAPAQKIPASPGGQMANTWSGTLKTSDNADKGEYEIMVGGHNIYIKTSRDYSALVGQQVNVSYEGTTDNFMLGDITAASGITEPK